MVVAGPALLLGATALTWSVIAAFSVAGILYFTVALPLVITAAFVGGLLFSAFAAKLLVAGSMLASTVIGGSALLLLYYTVNNKLPPLPPSMGGFAAVASSNAPQTKLEAKDEVMEDWDRRFADVAVKLRFQDLSPDSPVATLRAFLKQEGLAVKTGGRTKEAIYMEIADHLRRRGQSV